MNRKDMDDFMDNVKDFGATPPDFELTDEQKKLSSLSMAINATLIQFINEGFIPADQQLHFMGHLQDFMQRLYEGENLALPNTRQTLQLKSKAGTLYYQAAEEAFKHGRETFSAIKEAAAQMRSEMEQASGKMTSIPKNLLN